jgi:hypothetical protein
MAALFIALLPFLALLPLPTRIEWGPRIMARLPSTPVFRPLHCGAGGGLHFSRRIRPGAANLSVDATLHAIGISVVLSSLGSVAAYWLNDRIGLRLPIGGAILLMTIMLFGMILGSWSAVLFLIYISLLQIDWIFLNCYLYTALIDANNLRVPAATPFSALGSVVGASAMGYVLDRGGMIGSLGMTVGAVLLTAVLTMPSCDRTQRSALERVGGPRSRA